MSLKPNTRYTFDEYLTLERSTEVRHDFLDGEVFAMTGASYAHNVVVANTVCALGNQLRVGPCTVVANRLRVRGGTGRLYTYPDVIVVCGAPQIEQPGDTLINPTVILEVLSDATEAYDRGKKFQHYRATESLSDYLLVSQDRYQIERFTRGASRALDLQRRIRKRRNDADRVDRLRADCGRSVQQGRRGVGAGCAAERVGARPADVPGRCTFEIWAGHDASRDTALAHSHGGGALVWKSVAD